MCKHGVIKNNSNKEIVSLKLGSVQGKTLTLMIIN